MAVKIALPKGRLLRRTAAMLQKAEWGLDEYHSRVSFYRPKSARFPDLQVRIFNERDIPIQIAMGNYDLGICCLDWIQELLVKYPSSEIIKLRDLGYGCGSLYMASTEPMDSLCRGGNGSPLRIASEYPNLAEAFALRNRLDCFNVFPVWGAAEAYPPENAELVLLSAERKDELLDRGMLDCSLELRYSAFLIANRRSWEAHDLQDIVASLYSVLPEREERGEGPPVTIPVAYQGPRAEKNVTRNVRLALPDGHQQEQTVTLLNEAGITMQGYPSETGERRPGIDVAGVTVKVIRPQDMPLQVANGNFDVAVTGRDWLNELKDKFPSAPVAELLDLKLRKVRIVSVVHNSLDINDTAGLREWTAGLDRPLRIASEYVNIADAYGRNNHLGHYSVIPTYGASEAFLPEDADVLIENTETGRTIALHNLKIIETLFESTACLIGNTDAMQDGQKRRIIEGLIARLGKAVAQG